MRDKKRDQDYWLKKIAITNVLHAEWKEKLKTEIVDEERLKRRKGILAGDFWSLLIYNYNLGTPIEEIIPYYREYVIRYRELWDPKEEVIKVGREQRVLKQYSMGIYDSFLMLLSWGILVKIEDEIFNSIVKMIDEDEVKDHLLEFLIRFRNPDREKIENESYEKYYAIPTTYFRLRSAIDEIEEDENASKALIKEFLEKEWYKGHKDSAWYDSHKREGTYSGYWSWESAAVTVALGLDDSEFKDNEYYPKDLINYYYSK
jgi:hypothetical protein